MVSPLVWVALDGLKKDERATLKLAHTLDTEVDGNFGFKVNADWIYHKGFAQSPLKALPKRPVFLDLKQWFGARTMTEILDMCWSSGAMATNIYALAGALNPEEGNPQQKGELTKAIASFRTAHPRSDMHIYAVSILTHYGEAYVRRHFGRSLSEELSILAEETLAADADGIIMPGTHLGLADSIAGLERIPKIFPGTRWEDFADDRHAQEVHPSVVRRRDDVELVCGSPIYKSKDPVESLRTLLNLVR